jgi:hypothetical protein
VADLESGVGFFKRFLGALPEAKGQAE